MDKNDIYETLLNYLVKRPEVISTLQNKNIRWITNDNGCINFKWHKFRRYCEVSVANEYSIKSIKFTYNEINAIANFALYKLEEGEETNE